MRVSQMYLDTGMLMMTHNNVALTGHIAHLLIKLAAFPSASTTEKETVSVPTAGEPRATSAAALYGATADARDSAYLRDSSDASGAGEVTGSATNHRASAKASLIASISTCSAAAVPCGPNAASPVPRASDGAGRVTLQ